MNVINSNNNIIAWINNIKECILLLLCLYYIKLNSKLYFIVSWFILNVRMYYIVEI